MESTTVPVARWSAGGTKKEEEGGSMQRIVGLIDGEIDGGGGNG